MRLLFNANLNLTTAISLILNSSILYLLGDGQYPRSATPDLSLVSLYCVLSYKDVGRITHGCNNRLETPLQQLPNGLGPVQSMWTQSAQRHQDVHAARPSPIRQSCRSAECP